MDTNTNEFIWNQRYRPQKIVDCILPPRVKSVLESSVKDGTMQHMLFTGCGGAGKTTAARCIAAQLGADFMVINASEENGIDVLRNKIKQYASSVSLGGDFKIILLDEADHITPQAQAALRGFMEEFSSNCRFILTCNFKNKIIEPLHSRCTVIDFNPTKAELVGLCGQFMTRAKQILDLEGVKYEKPVLAEIIMRHAPDWRRTLNELQKASSATKAITTEAILTLSDASITTLIGYIKDKDFKSMRGWVVENSDVDSASIFRRIYDVLSETAEPQSVPQAVLILADYSYKSSFVVDQELSRAACFVELMGNINWK